jgi:hypothetical protein
MAVVVASCSDEIVEKSMFAAVALTKVNEDRPHVVADYMN